MKRIFALAFLTFSSPAFAVEFAPEPGGYTVFDTPSNNVCCLYNPDGGYNSDLEPTGEPMLTCDRVNPVYWKVELFVRGKARVLKTPGEVPGCGNPNVLQYGKTWSEGQFSCKSEITGLKCRRGKNGFKVNRKGIQIN
jgi:hypothetical protein